MLTQNNVWKSLLRGLVIALSAVFEIYAIALLFDKKVTLDFSALIFSLSIAVYSFDFISEYRKSPGLSHQRINRLLSIPIFFTAVLLVFSIFFGDISSFLFMILILFSGLLYDSFFKNITKVVPIFKDVFVALNWNMILWFFLIYYDYNLSLGFLLILVFIFSRDFVNASFCDIKDYAVDSKQKLSTLVYLLGKARTYTFLQILNVISVIMLITFSIVGLIPSASLVLVFPVAITSGLLIYSRSSNNYSPYLVDLEYFIWFLTIAFYKSVAG